MKRLLAPIAGLLFLGPATAVLHAGPDLPEYLGKPVLIYDCDTAGDFKYSQVFTEVPGLENGDQLCLYGSGFSSKFRLKSFFVQQGDCWVRIVYGDCRTEKGIHKAYWFESNGSNPDYDPDFCNLDVDCSKVVDSVCDGIVMKKAAKEQRLEMTGYDYGKKFFRSIFEADDNSWDDPSTLELLGFDYGGAMTKCRIQTTMPPTMNPFKYLYFCNYDRGEPSPMSRETRSADICAPKSLCGPFFSYCLNRTGYTMEYPALEYIEVDEDLEVSCPDMAPTRDYGWPSGYDFACIFACAKYRLNTSLTSSANLLDDVCDYGNAGHGFLWMPNSEEELGFDCQDCSISQGSLEYGVLVASLYLESKGYQFNRYFALCAIRQAIGLPEQPF